MQKSKPETRSQKMCILEDQETKKKRVEIGKSIAKSQVEMLKRKFIYSVEHIVVTI